MTKDKKQQNLRCTDCREQIICSSVDEGLEKLSCGYDNGQLTDSCKINLRLDGVAVFGIHKITQQSIKDSEDKTLKTKRK